VSATDDDGATNGASEERAALEEERDFLLASIRDLEREHAAGDVDDADYQTLLDGYTVRAAQVVRALDGDRSDAGTADSSPAGVLGVGGSTSGRRAVRIAIGVLAVGALAVGIGLALASAWGEREVGQEITGRTPGDEVRTVLVAAREAMRSGAFGQANQLFATAIDLERGRGVDNPEAIAYFGWTLALLSVDEPDDVVATERLDAARLALGQAIESDPAYPDPYCFLAIVEYQFLDDADRALPNIEQCVALDPPAEVAELVDAFAEEIRTAASS
jgi:tetratricopeptide (TPR) repeat protein